MPTITQDTTIVGIATINPFRYRGYYYDTEIGMYYLQSRYYDPIVGRFVNEDEVLFAFICNDTVDSNLFTYCKNNSVVRKDVFGYASNSTQLTYEGITCKKEKKGFTVPFYVKFLSKSFCNKYAKAVIDEWGTKKRFLEFISAVVVNIVE